MLILKGNCMVILKYLVIGFISFILLLFFIGSGTDSKNYTGLSINAEWDAQTTCSTARMMLKKKFSKAKSKELYDLPCKVSKVSAPLLGRFSIYDPYAVSWPNGVAARVFVTGEGLRIMGVSENGIPSEWI